MTGSRTPARDAEIVRLWNAGVTTNRIAARLGLESRNVVIGVVNRARARGEPVLTVNNKTPPVGVMARPAAATMPSAPVPVGDVSRRRRQAQAVCGGGIATAANGSGGYVSRWVGGKACAWPEGDPRARDFRFCGAAALPGKPYCPEHCARAYDRRATAEAQERAAAADVRAPGVGTKA